MAENQRSPAWDGDEIDFPAYQRNPASLDSFLRQYTVADGMRFLTYPKLAALQTVWETYFSNLVERFGFTLSPGEKVVDIGAHHGIVSLNCGRLKAYVFAFEPNPINFTILQRNIRLNPGYRILAEQVAVAGTNQRLEFNFGKTSTTGALKVSKRDWKRTEIDCTIQTVTLSSIFEKYALDGIKLLKVDCEGGEYDIFMSSSMDIIRKAQYVCLEAHPTRSYSPDQMVRLLLDAGFRTEYFVGDHDCLEIFCKREG